MILCRSVHVGETKHDRVDRLAAVLGDLGNVVGDNVLRLGLGLAVHVCRVVRRGLLHWEVVEVSIHLKSSSDIATSAMGLVTHLS